MRTPIPGRLELESIISSSRHMGPPEAKLVQSKSHKSLHGQQIRHTPYTITADRQLIAPDGSETPTVCHLRAEIGKTSEMNDNGWRQTTTDCDTIE